MNPLLTNPASASLSRHAQECWDYESIDLLRKFLLASVVLVVAPNTKMQLWFGLAAGTAAFTLCLKLEPYRSPLCQRLQLAALLQVLFTYMAATVFYTDPRLPRPTDAVLASDILLVAANCVCFVMLLFVLLRTAVKRTTDLRLHFDGERTTLHPPRAGQYHLILSHVWLHAQDQVADIKNLIRVLVPEARCFLEYALTRKPRRPLVRLLHPFLSDVACVDTRSVDNLESIADLEVYLQQSDVMLLFLTKGYLASRNCRRELIEALRLEKPLLVVRETDANHGAVTQHDLHNEVANVDLDEAERRACHHVIDTLFPQAVEWHREAHLKHAALGEIVTALFQHTNGEAPVVRVIPLASDSSAVRNGGSVIRRQGPPCSGVYVSQHYPRTVRQQLADALSVPILEERHPGTPAVLLLCPGFFEVPALVEELQSLVSWSPLVPLYSTELPFAAYMQRCPNELREAGLFKIMFAKWPESDKLRKVAAEYAVSKLSEHEVWKDVRKHTMAATGAAVKHVRALRTAVQPSNARRMTKPRVSKRPLLKTPLEAPPLKTGGVQMHTGRSDWAASRKDASAV